MILPPNFAVALMLMIVATLFLAGWANTFKAGAKWRYELYFLDFVIGAVVTVLVCALTVGSLGYDGFTFMDDVMHAGKNQWLMAFIAGAFLCSGTLFTLAAVSTGGMSIGFAASMGTTAVVGAILSRALEPGAANGTLLFAGAALSFTAIFVAAACYRMMAVVRHEAIARAGKAKTTKRPAPLKAIILGAVGGLLIAVFPPFLKSARATEIGLGPYAAMFFVMFGGALSVIVLSLFLMNLPVEGDPVDAFDYVKGTIATHVRGVVGGVIWCAGVLSLLVVSAGNDNYHISTAAFYLFAQGWPLLAALCGLLIWKEFEGADGRISVLLGVMMLLLAGGLGLLAMATMLPTKAA